MKLITVMAAFSNLILLINIICFAVNNHPLLYYVNGTIISNFIIFFGLHSFYNSFSFFIFFQWYLSQYFPMALTFKSLYAIRYQTITNYNKYVEIQFRYLSNQMINSLEEHLFNWKWMQRVNLFICCQMRTFFSYFFYLFLFIEFPPVSSGVSFPL